MDGPQSAIAATGASMVGSVLEHHGVKGMKWGSRKSSANTSSHLPPSADHVTAEAHRAKIRAGGLKALSNNELQSLNTRMQLEQQHRSLAGQSPSKFETGHRHVKRVLAVGKTLNDIHNTLNGPAGKALKKAVTK